MSPFRDKTPDESLGFLLWKLSSIWQQKIALVLIDFDINQTQFAILASLKWFSQNDQIATQVILAEHAQIEKMTLSKSIRLLEAKGLVARSPSKVDARSISIKLTRHGNRVIEQAVVEVEDADRIFFSSMRGDDLKQYKQLTQHIINDSATES